MASFFDIENKTHTVVAAATHTRNVASIQYEAFARKLPLVAIRLAWDKRAQRTTHVKFCVLKQKWITAKYFPTHFKKNPVPHEMSAGYSLSEIVADTLPGTVAADLAVGPPLNPPSASEHGALLVGAAVSFVMLTVLQRPKHPLLGSGRGHRVDVRNDPVGTPYFLSRPNVLAGSAAYWTMRFAGYEKTLSAAVAIVAGYGMMKWSEKQRGVEQPPKTLKRVLADERVTPDQVNFITRQPLPIAGSIQ